MPDADDDLRVLFHRLNNALGVILAHAELLHTKAPDDQNRARAAHVVESALDAMTTVREIRQRVPETSAETRAGASTPRTPQRLTASPRSPVSTPRLARLHVPHVRRLHSPASSITFP